MLPAGLSIVTSKDPSTIARLGALRVQALRESNYILGDRLTEASVILDEADFMTETVHFIAQIEGNIVGSGRISYHSSPSTITYGNEILRINPDLEVPCLSLNHLFVLRNFRGLGIGGLLHSHRIKWAVKQPAHSILAVAFGFQRTCSLLSQGFKGNGTLKLQHEFTIPDDDMYLLTAQVKDLKMVQIPALLRIRTANETAIKFHA